MNAEQGTLDSHRHAALIASLRRSRIFSDLSHEDIEAVAEGCRIRTLEKGECLFREGEVAEGFYVLQSGQISIFRVTPDGREQIICVFRPPESFAEATLATLESYPANAVALENARVIVVNKAHFCRLIARKPTLALHMLASMSLHLKHLVQLVQDYRGRQVEARLAAWFMEQSPAAAAGCPCVFELPVAKKVLAGQLGVTGETLSRTFARFRDESIIRVIRSRIHVLDAAKLRAYAEGDA